nr:MAG TPA: hypothetical protein [Caudoviricetes sp.]
MASVAIDMIDHNFPCGTVLLDREGIAWQRRPSVKWSAARVDGGSFPSPPAWHSPYKILHTPDTKAAA